MSSPDLVSPAYPEDEGYDKEYKNDYEECVYGGEIGWEGFEGSVGASMIVVLNKFFN